MKKILFLIAIPLAVTANAQNYFITFAGTGAANTVDSVKVENLRSGISLTLKGGDILHLTGTVGIPLIENEQPSELKIYPNPMTENSILEVCPPVTGDAIIKIYEITGKQVFQDQSYMENGKQAFRISGMDCGLYLISIKGRTYQYSGKLLCIGKANGTINIEKLSSNNVQSVEREKSRMDDKGSYSMPMLDGDRLMYTGYSGNYGTVTTDVPEKDSTIVFDYVPCSDGVTYYVTVKIGTQIWMARDLQTIKYNDGSPIPLGPISTATPAFVFGTANPLVYGYLYNWYAVNTGKLCPIGWHVPSLEWGNLTRYIGGDKLTIGGKLKETGTGHWIDPNYAATNQVGFTALPGGFYDSNIHRGIGEIGYWWTPDPIPGGSFAEYYCLTNDRGDFLNTGYKVKEYYFSVRCVKDN